MYQQADCTKARKELVRGPLRWERSASVCVCTGGVSWARIRSMEKAGEEDDRTLRFIRQVVLPPSTPLTFPQRAPGRCRLSLPQPKRLFIKKDHSTTISDISRQLYEAREALGGMVEMSHLGAGCKSSSAASIDCVVVSKISSPESKVMGVGTLPYEGPWRISSKSCS